MFAQNVININLYPSDKIFNQSERMFLVGSSASGKTEFVQNLVRKYVHRFYRIVICGNPNELLNFPETKSITELYQGNGVENAIFNPFIDIDQFEVKKHGNKMCLIIIDDLMDIAFKSSVVSQLFSKGRHLNVSTILIMQSFFATGSGVNLLPQIKNNCTMQIFTKNRSLREMGLIASRLEHDKKSKTFFLDLYKKTVLEKRYGYLAVFLDCSDEKIKYGNNLLDEDGSPYLTIFTM